LTATLVGLADIEAAAARIRGIAVKTPLIEWVALHRGADPGSGADLLERRSSPSDGGYGPRSLFLKCENLQPMGAFKMRGALNFLAQLSPESRAAGVITYSSGNHGQAVALAAQRLGLPCVVVMPETAPRVKVDGVRRYGGEVMFAGTTSTDRRMRAEAEAAARGLTIVPPFDHPWIIAGAGTCGLEILEQRPDVAAVYVPIGGGGLLSGISTAIKARKPAVRVIGVEPAGAARMTASRAAGHRVRLEKTTSIADGLLTLEPGVLTFAHMQTFVDDIVTVEEEEIAAAVGWLFKEAQIVAEPSGAASVAAVLGAGTAIGPGTVAVISGGNVAPEDHARYIRSYGP
jgi:threonine dehydratase